MPPPPPPTAVLGTLVSRNATGAALNVTTQALHVICEFPLSGQYGPGSRFLYYALVAACVWRRKSELLMKACLAAALVFPAVAAIHGIVLAALHRDGVVDMDVFGAFQLCAIGILAAPATVKLSSTYFNNPGRNFIFVWAILILTGLLSLTVEFFRSNASPCPYDDFGQPLSSDARSFNYNNPPTCNLTCSIASGPFSPIRTGSANNIYVVPSPERITFGMGTLLAAGCCIPAVLYLVSMWNEILKLNWKSRFDNNDVDEKAEITGTNGATLESMTKVDENIEKWLFIPEALVFSAAVLYILVIGEVNFFSHQVSWQTEQMSAIGQWAQIVGIVLAFLGMQYHVRHNKRLNLEKETNLTASKSLNSAKHEGYRDKSPAPSHNVATRGAIDGRYSLSNGNGKVSTEIMIGSLPRAATGGRTPPEGVPPTGTLQRAVTWGAALSDRFTTAGPDQFDDSAWRRGLAQNYPEVPGEGLRNEYLDDIKNRYDGNVTPLRKQHSRPGSITGSTNPGLGINVEGNTTVRSKSPRRSHSSTSPAEQIWVELQNVTSHTSAGSNGDMPQRQPTLEVSALERQDHEQTFSASSITFDNSDSQSPRPPAIVVSHDSQELDPDVS